MSNRNYTKTSKDVTKEFEAAEKREDLSTAEIELHGGCSLKEHIQATLAAAERPTPKLGAPLCAPTLDMANKPA